MSEETQNSSATPTDTSAPASNPILDKLRENQGPGRYTSPRLELGQSGGEAPVEAPPARPQSGFGQSGPGQGGPGQGGQGGFRPRPQQDSRKPGFGNRPQGGRGGRGPGGPGGNRGPRPEGDQDPNAFGGATRLGDVPENWGVSPAPKPTPASQVDRKIDPLDEMMEAELQASFGGIQESLETIKTERPIREAGAPGKKGVVFRIHNGDVFVEIPGGRSQGMLTRDQFPEGLPEIGTELDIKIERFDPANGQLILSRKGQAVANADWDSLAKGMVVEAKVTAVKASGLEIMVNSCRGWLPASQVDIGRTFDLNIFADQKLTCEVTEIDPHDHNLIVSRRALLERERAVEAEKLWAELAEGQVRKGIVRSLQSFGAFVDIGGADALLPISQISWKRINDISEILSPGQQVEVKILTVDPETRKISVGLKQLLSSPWQTLAERFRPGTIVTGKVTRTEDFGAFVELEPEIEGLVHISELGKGKVRRTSDVVKTGDEVKVMVLTIEPDTRRVSLSIKATLDDGESAEPETTAASPSAPAVPAKPSKPRTTPLRGGMGNGGPLIPPIW